MELRHLRSFKAVAELLSFSRAAEILCVAQPALSRQIRALEDELGATLFDRNRVRVRLTDSGRAFYAQTCKILAQVDIAVATVREVHEGVGGELIICADWLIGGQLVSAALAEFRARHPRTEVVLQDRKIYDHLKLVLSERVHLGFVVRDIRSTHPDLQTMLLSRSQIGVILPPTHALAGRQRVQLAELANETWIVADPKETPDHVHHLRRVCRLSGFTPRLGMTATTSEGIIGRVASGYGIALFPEHLLALSMELPAFVHTDCAPIELCAVWHRQNKSKLLQQFLTILRRQVIQPRVKPAA